jgi:septal ring factor EnvC (AmiA/AmiB activator)
MSDPQTPDGKPCDWCGSTEHRFVMHGPPHALCVKHLEQALVACQQERDNLETMYKILESSIIESAEEITQLRTERATLEQDITDRANAAASLVEGIRLLEVTCNAEHKRAITAEAELATVTDRANAENERIYASASFCMIWFRNSPWSSKSNWM